MPVFSQGIDESVDNTGAIFPFTESVNSGSIENTGNNDVEIYLHQSTAVAGKAFTLQPTQIWDIDKPLLQFFFKTAIALEVSSISGLGEGD